MTGTGWLRCVSLPSAGWLTGWNMAAACVGRRGRPASCPHFDGSGDAAQCMLGVLVRADAWVQRKPLWPLLHVGHPRRRGVRPRAVCSRGAQAGPGGLRRGRGARGAGWAARRTRVDGLVHVGGHARVPGLRDDRAVRQERPVRAAERVDVAPGRRLVAARVLAGAVGDVVGRARAGRVRPCGQAVAACPRRPPSARARRPRAGAAARARARAGPRPAGRARSSGRRAGAAGRCVGRSPRPPGRLY